MISYVTPDYMPRGLYIVPQRDLHIHVYCCLMHTNQEMEPARCPLIAEWIWLRKIYTVESGSSIEKKMKLYIYKENGLNWKIFY